MRNIKIIVIYYICKVCKKNNFLRHSIVTKLALIYFKNSYHYINSSYFALKREYGVRDERNNINEKVS